MTHHLRPVGLDFLDAAPLRLEFTTRVAASPEAVFGVLRDVGSWPRWFAAVSRARPLDGGERREIRLRGGVRFTETIVAAVPATAYAYRVDTTNAPGPRALLEEWRLAPAGTGTRVRYTFALDAPAWARAAARLGRPGIGRAFRQAMRALDREAAAAGRNP